MATQDASAAAQTYIERIGCDSVYFLMFDGWKQELRSNRWHFATRWARHLPVTLVQPHNVAASATVLEEPVPEIPNTRILWIKRAISPFTYLHDTFGQAAEVAKHMAHCRYARPLLWLYNPQLVGLYAATPAVARIFHATENFFDFEGRPRFFYDQVRAALRLSDTAIAVSEGVARSIREEVPGIDVAVVSNGCDYGTYARGQVTRDFRKERDGFDRLAVYCGNINARLDFELLHECCGAFPSTKFAFYGPVKELSGQDTIRWQSLLRQPNVSYCGPIDPNRLPDVYASADVGIIPYKQLHVLVENGFPLKALEMGATGLPVISTLMKPIGGLAAAIHVVESTPAYLAALAKVDRSTIGAAEREQLDQVCQMHDYDAKFRDIGRGIAGKAGLRFDPATRLDALVASGVSGGWREFLEERIEAIKPAAKPGPGSTAPVSNEAEAASPAGRRLAASGWGRRVLRRFASFGYRLLPDRARPLIPSRLRTYIRTRLGSTGQAT